MTHIEQSIIVEASPEAVWQLFADFGAVDDWHPYFEEAHLDPPEPAIGVGASRVCSFGPKMQIRETVVEWADLGMTIRIDFLKGPPSPLRDLLAAVEVSPVEGGAELKLLLDYRVAWGPFGWLLDHLAIRRQYRKVFVDMLAAAKGFAEHGTAPAPIAMLGSGRVLNAATAA